MSEEREPYSSDAVEIGFNVGYISSLSGARSRKKKNPIGFAPPARKPRTFKGVRQPGSFPDVPRFDVL